MMYAARPPQSCPMTANRSHSSASAKSKASCARATPLPSRKVSTELNRVGPNPRSQGATQRKPALSSAGVIFLQPPTSSGHPCSNRTGGPDSGPPHSKTTSGNTGRDVWHGSLRRSLYFDTPADAARALTAFKCPRTVGNTVCANAFASASWPVATSFFRRAIVCW